MFWLKLNESTPKVSYMAAVMCFTAALLFFAGKYLPTAASATQVKGIDKSTVSSTAPSATFPADAPSLGAIPDNPMGCGNYAGATPKDVTFAVSGMTAPLSDVRISTTFNPVHTWRGDLSLELRSPGNVASKIIYRNTGSTTATGCGNSNDLAGPYNFFDTAALTTWNTIAGTPTPAGDYQAVTPCGVVGCGTPTPITPSFTGLSAAQINGTWTLRILDGGAGDTGSISAATLTLTAGPAVVNDANADYNGDGRTDFIVARATTTPFAEGAEAMKAASDIVNRPRSDMEEKKALRNTQRDTSDNVLAPPIYWYTSLNGSGATSVIQLGDAATDVVVTEDFDGDGRDDIAVWRPGAPNVASFYILQSSTVTIRQEVFGQDGDDPAIVGDYDGDNRADPAVFRCPAFGAGDGQCFFFYRGSNANPAGNITYVPWGFGESGDFFPLVGDFDGDGKNDFCIQRSNPSATTQGQFVLLKSNGLGVEYINWGLSTDFLIPGDYDGDGLADFCVRRTVSGVRQHWVLERDGGTQFINWGVTGDSSAPGDYDGDGKTDFAIWRQNADPDLNFFWVRNSSNGSVTNFEWGQQFDFAVAGWAVH